jgi:hypothetical protein
MLVPALGSNGLAVQVTTVLQLMLREMTWVFLDKILGQNFSNGRVYRGVVEQ